MDDTKKRFKITLESGKEYFIYATDALQATQIFKENKHKFWREATLVEERVIAKVKEDKEEWKTSYFDGRVAPGA